MEVYFEVDWKVEEVKFPCMVLIQCPHKHIFIVPVRDILDHERRLPHLLNVLQIDDELPRVDFVLSLLFLIVWISSHVSYVAVLLSLSAVIHSDIYFLVSHLLVLVHLTGLLYLTGIAVLNWVERDLLPHLLHPHLLLHLLDLEPVLLHLH